MFSTQIDLLFLMCIVLLNGCCIIKAVLSAYMLCLQYMIWSTEVKDGSKAGLRFRMGKWKRMYLTMTPRLWHHLGGQAKWQKFPSPETSLCQKDFCIMIIAATMNLFIITGQLYCFGSPHHHHPCHLRPQQTATFRQKSTNKPTVPYMISTEWQQDKDSHYAVNIAKRLVAKEADISLSRWLRPKTEQKAEWAVKNLKGPW